MTATSVHYVGLRGRILINYRAVGKGRMTMKLDRNIRSNDGRGKYALLKLRRLDAYQQPDAFMASPVLEAIALLDREGLIEWGAPKTEGEFFVLKLRDQFAAPALKLYAFNAAAHDRQYADDVMELANRASYASPFCKLPD